VEIVLVIFLIVAVAAAAFFAWKAHQSGRALRDTNEASQRASEASRQAHETNANLGRHVEILQEQVQRLNRYQTVVDAEATANALRTQTEAWAAQLRRQTELSVAQLSAEAQAAAARVTADASAQATQAQAAAHATTTRASAEAARVVADANQRTEAWAAQYRAQTEAWATQVTTTTRRDAERLTADARAQTAQAQAAANATTARAAAEATRIVDEATRRAEETAGAALAATRDAKRLEKTAQAMKNVIEGYGDRYVVPTAGLLDDLAEEFGFAEGGQRLKSARERVRGMIQQGTAATCDYVEANRRTTAIEFVLDAFNGKTDTVLADVRHDNFGTLQQKIRDAFALVNHNGRAFRDARIHPEYLDARLDELRWAVVVNELKVKEREQQRQIKERIREEERAQREIEKAIKEAEKEQDTLRKAMDKARRDVEKSTDEERARYEQKLRELTDRLHIAEEKNQRAISLAQQTKSGHVYVISNVGSFGEHVYKIGMTRRFEPLDRVRELGDASVPFEFDVHAMIPSLDAPALERALHQKFVRNQVNKVNPRKEFFRVSLPDVRTEIERLGTEVTWTLTAQARELRETQAVERAMANKTLDEGAWIQQQKNAEAAVVEERESAEAMA